MKPFLSVLIIIGTLFTVVFLKMEVRRMGYSVLKLSREYKTAQDRRRILTMKLANFNRPERLRELAQRKSTLVEAKLGQIIQLSGEKIALRQ